MTSKGIAIVTGAAQGIGRAIALRLADDGYDIAVNDIVGNAEKLRSLEEEIKAKGRRACARVADVSVESEVREMVDAVVQDLGGLDVVRQTIELRDSWLTAYEFVANAGILTFRSLVDTNVEDWDRLHSVNTRGTFLCYKYAAKQMISQGRGGRIVGACSGYGKIGSAFVSAYCSTKFAIRGLTQAAAIELGPHGITVNAYAPGAIDTDMGALSHRNKSLGKSEFRLVRYLDKVSAETTGGKVGDL